jgi:hypothetical protein
MTKTQAQELKAMLEGVDRFADAMKAKLRRKAAEGYHGGFSRRHHREVERLLMEHVGRLSARCSCCGARADESEPRQAIDVANLAMMLWHIGGRPVQ